MRVSNAFKPDEEQDLQAIPETPAVGVFYRRPYDMLRTILDIVDSVTIAVGTAILTMVSVISPGSMLPVFISSVFILVARAVITDTINIEDVESRMEADGKLHSSMFTCTSRITSLWARKYGVLVGIPIILWVFATASASIQIRNTAIILNSCIDTYGRQCCLYGVGCADSLSQTFYSVAPSRFFTPCIFFSTLQVLAAFVALTLWTTVMVLHLLTYTYIGTHTYVLEDRGLVHYHPWELPVWMAVKGTHSLRSAGILDVQEDRRTRFLPWLRHVINRNVAIALFLWLAASVVLIWLSNVAIVGPVTHIFFPDARWMDAENAWAWTYTNDFLGALEHVVVHYNNTRISTYPFFL